MVAMSVFIMCVCEWVVLLCVCVCVCVCVYACVCVCEREIYILLLLFCSWTWHKKSQVGKCMVWCNMNTRIDVEVTAWWPDELTRYANFLLVIMILTVILNQIKLLVLCFSIPYQRYIEHVYFWSYHYCFPPTNLFFRYLRCCLLLS